MCKYNVVTFYITFYFTDDNEEPQNDLQVMAVLTTSDADDDENDEKGIENDEHVSKVV